MKPQIDTVAAGQFFVKVNTTFAGLRNYFDEFHKHLSKIGGSNPYFNWKVLPISATGRSFEVEYLTVRIRAVLSIRPAVDDRGVVSFYLLNDFDTPVTVIDYFDYDPEYGETQVADTSGSKLYIGVEGHAMKLLVEILHQAYV